MPGLGLKRGLSEDVVVAPYASLLALPIDSRARAREPRRHRARGRRGSLGLLRGDRLHARAECLPGETRAVVKAYFAHHQGMSFVAVGNELTGEKMRHRFHADPLVVSAELLLAGARAATRADHAPARRGGPLRALASRASAAGRALVPACRHAGALDALPVERALLGHGHQRRRRLQPLRGPRRLALSRRRHARLLGHVLLHPRHRRAARSSRRPTSPAPRRPTPTR